LVVKIKVPQSAPSARTFRWPNLSAAKDYILKEYVVGQKPAGEVRDYVLSHIARPTSKLTWDKQMLNWGFAAARRRIAEQVKATIKVASAPARRLAQSQVMHNAKQKAISKGVSRGLEKVEETVVKRMQKGAENHINRMEAQLEKAHTVLDSMEPDAKTLGTFLGHTDKWDQMARRLYGMDRQEPMNPQQFNVAVLVQMGDEEQEDVRDVSPVHEAAPDGDNAMDACGNDVE
jgi:hypothetical protein